MSESSAVKLVLTANREPNKCRPILKWAGGKTYLLLQLKKRFPKKYNIFYEPFVGGGALFFACQPQKSCLIDINHELINLYKVVREKVEELIIEVARHKYDKDYFYTVRDWDRKPGYSELSEVARAGRLLFLNKTCFNGLYRVNSKGHFNVPFGKYTNPRILDADNLRAASAALQRAELVTADFTYLEGRVKKGDFVYFDPPYDPISTSSNFTAYTSDSFNKDMQIKLFELCRRLNSKGVHFMLSNSASPMIKDLYKDFEMEFVDVPRMINSKGDKRGGVREVIIRNYNAA